MCVKSSAVREMLNVVDVNIIGAEGGVGSALWQLLLGGIKGWRPVELARTGANPCVNSSFMSDC